MRKWCTKKILQRQQCEVFVAVDIWSKFEPQDVYTSLARQILIHFQNFTCIRVRVSRVNEISIFGWKNPLAACNVSILAHKEVFSRKISLQFVLTLVMLVFLVLELS